MCRLNFVIRFCSIEEKRLETMTVENNVESNCEINENSEEVVNGDLSETLIENESNSKPLPTATQQEIIFTDYV